VGYDRPIATLSSNGYLSNPTPSRWYDPAAFVEASSGSWGNVGRNTLIGPGIFALDFDLQKEFRMPGAAFPGQPSTNAHQGFGTITGTSVPMRQVQLALKYTF
jgi:hypothetical protein